MSVVDHRVHTLAATTHGRYLVCQPSGTPAGLLVGFHGYAENAAIHLEELRQIRDADQWVLVAVQGLHRFYNRQGQIVASWMTSKDREQAIGDNIAYVRDVVEAVRTETDGLARLVYVGFSQGVAMACRAAVYAGHASDGVIVLGGDVPPEIKAASRSLPAILIGRGLGDTFYTQGQLDADVAYLSAGPSTVETVAFDGGHEWTDEFRAAASRFLESCAHSKGVP